MDIGSRITGKIVSFPDHGNHLDFQQISMILPKFPKKFPYHGSVLGSQLPTFWTLPWYGNLLEVNFQLFGHFHGMEIWKGWKLTSNKFPYHGSVQKVGSWLPTNFHTMEVSKKLEVDFQQISIPWKCPKGWKYHGNLSRWFPRSEEDIFPVTCAITLCHLQSGVFFPSHTQGLSVSLSPKDLHVAFHFTAICFTSFTCMFQS